MSSQQIQKIRSSKVANQTSRMYRSLAQKPLAPRPIEPSPLNSTPLTQRPLAPGSLEVAPLEQRPLSPKSVSTPYLQPSFEMTNPNNILMGYRTNTLLVTRPNIVEGTGVNGEKPFNTHVKDYSSQASGGSFNEEIVPIDIFETNTQSAEDLVVSTIFSIVDIIYYADN